LAKRAPRRQKEAALTDRIRAALNALGGVRVWRNNTGIATHVKEAGIYKMRYGLGVGSPDLVGMVCFRLQLSISVHQDFGRFLGVEVKRPGEKQEPEQIEWQDLIQRFGGIYILTTSVGDAVQQVEALR
jgi:hypothetical protein